MASILKTMSLEYPNRPGFDWNYATRMGNTLAVSLGFGDDPSSFDVVQPGDWFVFIAIMFTMNILILNTLIAILGDSYEKVQMDKKVYETG